MSDAAPEPRNFVEKIDRGVYRVERGLAGSLFILMVLVMFAAVLADIFKREEGRLTLLLLQLTGGDPHDKFMHKDVSPWLNLGVAMLLGYAGVRTLRRAPGQPPIPRLHALGYGAALALGGAGVLQLMLKLLPNVSTWGADVALACMLWVGFLGASLATYEKRHLALEMAEKIWPPRMYRYVRAFAMLTAVAVCVFLLYLSYHSLFGHTGHYTDWAKERAAHHPIPTGMRLSGANTNIPVWFIFLIFPYTFGMMAIRFLGTAVAAAMGRESPPPPPVVVK